MHDVVIDSASSAPNGLSSLGAGGERTHMKNTERSKELAAELERLYGVLFSAASDAERDRASNEIRRLVPEWLKVSSTGSGGGQLVGKKDRRS